MKNLAYLLYAVLLSLVGCSSTLPVPPTTPNPNNPTPQPPPDNGACAFTVTEEITVDTVWQNTPSSCDYLLDPQSSGIVVSNGTLSVEPGTVVKFAQDVSLRISNNARLLAVGTPDARISFEGQSPVKGFAYGVHFSSPLASRIEYSDFRYLGKEDVGLFANQDAAISGALDSSLTLKHSTVSGSSFYGAKLEDVNLIEFTTNQFFDNARYSVVIDAAQVHKLDAESDYLGQAKANGRPYVLLEGVSSGEEAFETAVWKRLNAPYFIDIAVNIVGGTITVEPGTRFVFNEGASLGIDEFGALSAAGTPGAPIIFTGEQAQPGYWEGLQYFESSSRDNLLEYAQVRYAGGSSLIEGAVSVGLESYLKMSHTTVADSSSWGVCVTYISDEYQAVFENGEGNSFSNNPLGDIVYDCDD